MKLFSSLAIFILSFLISARSGELALQAARGNPDDLALSGRFRGIPKRETRFISRTALLALAGVLHLHEKPAGPIAAGDLTVLPFDRLLEAVPLTDGADGLVLICADRWETFLTAGFVATYRPYLLLTYDGRTPEQGWPTFGSIEPLAPYFANVSTTLGPKFVGVTDHGLPDATQILEIRAVNTRARYAPFFAGPLEKISPVADSGRKLFLQQCNNCHQGPAGVGGNVSLRPFAVLQIDATLNVDYFKKFVRNPKQFFPTSMMPRHEDFTDEMLAKLIAFLTAAKQGNVN